MHPAKIRSRFLVGDHLPLTAFVFFYPQLFILHLYENKVNLSCENQNRIYIMISEKDKTTILKIARKYKAKKVILFGSGSLPSKESHDIDLAVEGIPNAQFFKFYSELIFNLSKPVDIVDLSRKSRFNSLIVSEGVLLYG